VTLPAVSLPDGLVAVVKRDCPTCSLLVGVLQDIARQTQLTVATQDDPTFPEGIDAKDDTSLDLSYELDIETVPTLLRFENGREAARIVGWSRQQWQEFTGLESLGDGLPAHKPGCGSRTLDPEVVHDKFVREASSRLTSRRVEIGDLEDDVEACIARGWSDGLPVTPPTPERVARMLEGTSRDPSDVVAVVPPDLVACTVEKAAINAVMAGCRPEYLPVVLACIEAACTDEFNMHGLLATTYFSGPVVIVNGPVTKRIGMNSGVNVFGQGNRANSSIGRALQLVVRNVGGGKPDGVDRATLGNPGKLSFCFAEDEDDSPWESLAAERGVPEGKSAVTLFPGEGPRGIVDQLSRTPESLAKSFALGLRSVAHPKLAIAFDAILVVSPEHAARFRDAGWSKQRLREELMQLLTIPGDELVRGAGGCEEGLPAGVAGSPIPKFRPDGLLIVHAGGKAGLFSAIIGGWVSGSTGSIPVTRVIEE
jgi:hypothetical protein